MYTTTRCVSALMYFYLITSLGDPADDIQILSLQIVNKIEALASLSLLPYIDTLVDKLEESVAKFNKSINTKQEGERVKDCIRAFMRTVYSLSKVEEINNMPKFKTFYDEQILKSEKLKEFFVQANSDKINS